MVLEEVIVTAAKRGNGDYSSVPSSRRQMSEPSFDEVKYEADISVDFKIENKPHN